MILSVLIPTYQYNCVNLVRELSKQLPADAEIIVGDDGTMDREYQSEMMEINQIPQCRLWCSPVNIGRAAIRNRLAHEAKGEWLIFVDSDAVIERDDYISQYLSHQESDVVCGGTSSPTACPSPSVSLRYNYEKVYWKNNDARRRSLQPYDNFTTFNFMIRRDTFLSILFNEDHRGYGHEDTIFGNDLERHHIPILHIDNPMIHNGLDENPEYVRKTEEGIHALKHFSREIQHKSKLLNLYHKLRRYHLLPVLKAWHKVFGAIEKRNLCSTHPNLFVFKLYKLGYIATA